MSGSESLRNTTSAATGNPPNYGSLYGAFAVVAVALTGGQIYADVEQDGSSVHYLTLWQMLAQPSSVQLAMVSLCLLGVLVALCAVIAVRGAAGPGLPLGVASLALMAALMLMFKVGANPHHPVEFDTAGGMMLVLAWCAIILGIVHALHLMVLRRRQSASERSGAGADRAGASRADRPGQGG